MNKTLSITLAVIGGIILSVLLFCAGLYVGRTNLGLSGFNSTGMMGRGYANQGYSMMGNGYNMMGGIAVTNLKPLTIDQATQAVDGYLKGLNNSDLVLKEIMIFNNNAYARITEKSTGIGALELLVDPSTLSVYPEYGPNMMWNLKYSQVNGAGGIMGGAGGMMGGVGGMMSGLSANPGTVSATMTVTSEQALAIAQDYLDQKFPGYKTATDADPFYGYYTIDIMKDDNVTGMLSVNGFSGQVFLHTWHGTFVEMSE
jgi:hypothetical protein